MIDSSEKRNRQLAFKLQNSHVCEKCRKRTKIWLHLKFGKFTDVCLVVGSIFAVSRVRSLILPEEKG